MAEAQTWGQDDEVVGAVPATGQGVVIPAAPKDMAADIRAQTGTDINVSSEARQGREEVRKAALDLQSRYRSDENVKKYEGALPNYVAALKTQPNGSGDLSLVYHYAKTIDPTSTVGTGDMQSISTTDARLPAAAQDVLRQLRLSDGKFTDQARDGLRVELRNILEQRKQAYDVSRQMYAETAQAPEFGVNPELVIGKTPFGDKFAPEIDKYWKDKGTPGAEQLAITGGERFSTEADKAISAAVNQAFASGANVQQLVEAARGAGANVTAEDVSAFQQAVEARAKGQPVTFNTRQSGTRNPIAQGIGEFLTTPLGTGVTGAVNAAGVGLLSQVAGDQVQGLEALNPLSGMIGEGVGSLVGTAGLANATAGLTRALAPNLATRLAGGGTTGAVARELATEGGFGGLYAANTGEDIGTGLALGAAGSLGGRAIGAGVSRAAPVVSGLFRRGGDVPPDGGVPPMGGTLAGGMPTGGAPAGGAPAAGEAAMQAADETFVPETFRFNDAGSSGTSLETIRRMKAEGLPVPVELTLGAVTRDAEQLAFEKEQLFGALGGPLRRRAEENNLQILENFDQLINQTGAQTVNRTSTGNVVIDALTKSYDAAKNKVNVAYKRAEQAPEAQELVDYADVQQFINAQDEATKEIAPVLKSVAQQLAKNDPDKTGQISVATMENIRKLISQNTQRGTPGEVYGGQLKGLIDATTEGKGGDLYIQARKLRREQARKFEDRAVVARLVSNIKNMDDPKVSADKVFQKSILNAAPEEIQFLRRTLRTSGADGRQAWKELEGATVRHLLESVTRNASMTADDMPIVSAAKMKDAINSLDDVGRLDVIFDPKKAQTLRDLRDVIQYVSTVPPGTNINTSGTARTLMAMMGEMTATGGLSAYLTGSPIPVPLVTGFKMIRQGVKDNEIKKKIARSLVPSERTQ